MVEFGKLISGRCFNTLAIKLFWQQRNVILSHKYHCNTMSQSSVTLIHKTHPLLKCSVSLVMHNAFTVTS